MVYANINFQTKKALKEAVAAGKPIGVHQVGPFAAGCPQNGRATVEGPWYPQPHKWYATVELVDGLIKTVK